MFSLEQENEPDEGSDSNPSEDNMDSKEMLKIFPESEKLRIKKEEQCNKAQETYKQQDSVVSNPELLFSKSTIGQTNKKKAGCNKPQCKKSFNLKRKTDAGTSIHQYIEVVDSWTQTTNFEDK